jgi:hypothetical protein
MPRFLRAFVHERDLLTIPECLPVNDDASKSWLNTRHSRSGNQNGLEPNDPVAQNRIIADDSLKARTAKYSHGLN